MEDNQFLVHPFFSPQLIKDYRLPTTELKSIRSPSPDLHSQKDAHEVQAKPSDEGSPQLSRPKLIKRNRKTDIGNYPQRNHQRKLLLPKLQQQADAKQYGKIKVNKLQKEEKDIEKSPTLKRSITEKGETLEKYLQYKRHRERVELYSKSAVRKSSVQSAASRIKRNSGSQQLKRTGSTIQEEYCGDSRIRFVSLKTHILDRRRTFLDIFNEGKQQNRILGMLEMRIPKIPPKSELLTFITKYRPNNQEINLNSLLKANFCAVQYSEVELYIGQMIGKHKQGMGILITHKSCFEGLWKNNEKVKGIEIMRSGIYHGTYLNEKREGQGEFHRHSGDIYVGEWKEGKKHGVGLWINSRGESYSGSWQYGKPEGNATLTITGRTFKGNFSDFRQFGYGRQRYPNGDTFEGFFKGDLPNGKGVYTWKKGGTFEGNFINGLREGFGELRTNGDMIYRGYFVNDKPEGECQILMKNRQIWNGIAKNHSESKVFSNIYPDRIWKERLDL